MNSFPPFSSRIFTVAVSVSIVLCSISLLFFSIGYTPMVKAESVPALENAAPIPWDTELRGAVGLGVVKDTAYFIVWSNPNILYKASIRKARNWYSD